MTVAEDQKHGSFVYHIYTVHTKECSLNVGHAGRALTADAAWWSVNTWTYTPVLHTYYYAIYVTGMVASSTSCHILICISYSTTISTRPVSPVPAPVDHVGRQHPSSVTLPVTSPIFVSSIGMRKNRSRDYVELRKERLGISLV